MPCDQIKASTPLGRFGTVEEIASAVTFLASDEAACITGQVLAVDGGLVVIWGFSPGRVGAATASRHLVYRCGYV